MAWALSQDTLRGPRAWYKPRSFSSLTRAHAVILHQVLVEGAARTWAPGEGMGRTVTGREPGGEAVCVGVHNYGA